MPSVSPGTGTVAYTAMLTISGGTTGADIRYTVGVDSEASPLAAPTSVSDGNGYTSGTPVALNSLGDGAFPQTFTVKIVAFKDGTHRPSETVTRRYTVSRQLPQAATPSVSPLAGTVAYTAMLTISGGTTGASIRYTWGSASSVAAPASVSDGNGYTSGTPVALNSLGTGNFPRTFTVKIVAFKDGTHQPSATVTRRYTVSLPLAAEPTLGAMSVLSTDSLTIQSSTDGARIRYTAGAADVTAPTVSTGTLYVSTNKPTFASLVASQTTPYPRSVTVKAIAYKAGSHVASTVASRTFTVAYDVDADNDGLIEIRNLDMLANIGNDLAGRSYDDDSTDEGMSTDGGSTTGASATEPANCNDNNSGTTITLCGYELAQDLDFANGAHYVSGSVNDDWRPDDATNAGFNGFGAATGTTGGFTAIFDGNGHSIKNFYSRASNAGSRNVGLFRLLGSDGVIRNVGVTEANVYGGSGRNDRVGILVGVNYLGGRITTSYATGSADVGDGNDGYVGGLVGYNNGGTITASYATSTANGGSGNLDRIGGLVGYNNGGTITASYATGSANGGDGNDGYVGGLVGYNNGGTITASYASGSADGGAGNSDSVGGLVGENNSTITASYATGNVDGGDGTSDRVGGLLGRNDYGTITASYATGTANGNTVGGLVGWDTGGTITASYATGTANGNTVGGLVGVNYGTITASYATGTANGNTVGGLVGWDAGGTITASYAFGTVAGNEAYGNPGTSKPSAVLAPHDLKGNSGDATTYAGASWNSTGNNTRGAWNFGSNSQVPALVYADYDGGGTAHACSDYPAKIPGTTITLSCGNSLVGNYRPAMVEIPTFSLAAGNVLTTQTLTISTPTTGATIYYTTDGSIPVTTGVSRSLSSIAGRSSLTLSLGTVGAGMKNIRATAVKADYLNSVVASRTFTVQYDMADVDMDNNGLIEIYNLEMLDNIRHNLAGTTYDDEADDGAGNLGSTTGASTTEPANCNDNNSSTTITLCGYELIQDLDFAIAAHYPSGSVDADWRPNNTDPDDATNAGFNGFGALAGSTGGFTAIFEGNGHSIKNLYSRNTSTFTGNNVGLFRLLGSGASIRNVEVTEANVYGIVGSFYVGSLVGYNRAGATITASYASGSGNVNNSYSSVGGLVGRNDGTITASYATGSVDGGAGDRENVGGLVGRNDGIIIASYATGNVDGGNRQIDRVGGLVGSNNGTITASYATGNADGGDGDRDYVGGLVGRNATGGTITASYATGNADGGDGDNDLVGGLVGYNKSGSTITASYATGNADGGDGGGDLVGGLVGGNSGSTITASYAFGTVAGSEVTTLTLFTITLTTHDGTPPMDVTSLTLTVANSATEASGNRWSTTFWNFGTTSENPALVYNDYDGATEQPSHPVALTTEAFRPQYQVALQQRSLPATRSPAVEPTPPLWVATGLLSAPEQGQGKIPRAIPGGAAGDYETGNPHGIWTLPM